jgi:Tfp pilus assembly protein FimT
VTGRGGARRRPRPARRGTAAGVTFLDAIFALGVMGVLAAIAIPETMAGIERARTVAAARYLAARMGLARAQAVARAAHVALLFASGAHGFRVGMYRDGNRNGVRTREINSGVDPVVEAPVRISDLFPGVTTAPNNPANTGESALISFAPSGTASSGTVYLRGRDGSQYAVRVLGATGRTRVLRFRPATHEWIDVF